MRIFPAMTLAALALASCNDTSASAPEPSASEVSAPVSVAPEPSASPTPSVIDTIAPKQIPVAVQGRWGLVANDCDPSRDDAKGLLTIGPDTLTFYESRATLGEIKEIDASRIRASFDFAGEGMTWTHDEVLDAQDGGKTLVRREYGEDAAPGPLRYMRCP
jgi:hypothetical protein